MIIVDSNIIIYAAKAEYAFLRALLIKKGTYLSSISKVEALGFQQITSDDERYLKGLFNTAAVLSIDDYVIDKAVELRQQRKMSLGDAIIAATALLNGFELYTRNTADFTHIPGLTVVNPIDR
ncbi:type II toxin-antitoxin system VapC family toxin [Fibrella sp. WM1]|uniref:type II toxin-antitoxin system VapC family toxin n=1 Tax=Fibrella musci TaxID=3242485 RepID=UPI0035212C78